MELQEILEKLKTEQIMEQKMRVIFRNCRQWIEALTQYRVENVGSEEADQLQGRIDHVLSQLRVISEKEAGYLEKPYRELLKVDKGEAKEIEEVQEDHEQLTKLYKRLQQDIGMTKDKLSEALLRDIHQVVERIREIIRAAIKETSQVQKELANA